MDTPLAVRARGISKQFDDVIALDGVDLDISEGQIHGLVGPNGAGKTTLLGLMLGLATADRGELSVLGSSVTRSLAAPDGVAGFLDGPTLYPSLTARQNLSSLVSLRGERVGTDRLDEVLATVGLAQVADDRARGFSLGMRQRLALAAALVTNPALLILDEPSNGLDPAGKRQVHAVLTELAEQGTTIVLSSHRMDDVQALCSEVTILVTGRVRFTGTMRKLAAENGAIDHRLITSHQEVARRLVSRMDDVHLRPATHDGDELIITAAQSVLDDMVLHLAKHNVAVRELAPVTSPLEAAFLALTGDEHKEGTD